MLLAWCVVVAPAWAVQVEGVVGEGVQLVSVDTVAFRDRDGALLLVRLRGVSGLQEGQPCLEDLARERSGGEVPGDRCGRRALRWLVLKLGKSLLRCELSGRVRPALVAVDFSEETLELLGARAGGAVQGAGRWKGAEAVEGWCWSERLGDLGRAVVAEGWGVGWHSRYRAAEGWAQANARGAWGAGGFADPEQWLLVTAERSQAFWSAVGR